MVTPLVFLPEEVNRYIFVKNLTLFTLLQGLMAGGRGGGQGNYSSDEESDTEDYRNDDLLNFI